MNESECLPEETLYRLATDPDGEDGHLTQCEACWLAIRELREELGKKTVSPVWKRPAYVAAAALLLSVLGLGVWIPRYAGSPGMGAGELFGRLGEPGAVLTGPLERESAEDGAVRIEAETTVRVAGERGGRSTLVLEEGGIFLRTGDAVSAVRVETPAGAVEDIGTEFRVFAGVLEDPDGTWRIPFAVAEVTEGKVRLSNGAGSGEVAAGHRGFLRQGHPPEVQVEIRKESPGTGIEEVRRLKEALEKGNPGFIWGAFRDLVNRSPVSGAVWEEAVGDKEIPGFPQARRLLERNFRGRS